MPFSISAPANLDFQKIRTGRHKYKKFSLTITNQMGAPIDVVATSLNAKCKPIQSFGWGPAGDDLKVLQRVPVGEHSLELGLDYFMGDGTGIAPFDLTVEGKGSGTAAQRVRIYAAPTLGKEVRVSLIVDRSQSMGQLVTGGGSRMQQAVLAADVCLGLLNAVDHAELIYFSAEANTVVPLGQLRQVLASGRTRLQEIRHILSDPALEGRPSNSSSIAAGVQKATGTSKIVFTDCLENLAPYVRDLPADTTRHAVGLPVGNADVFNALGSGCRVATSAGFDAIFDFPLHKFVSTVLLQSTDSQIVSDPDARIKEGESLFFDFNATELDHEFTAILLSDDVQGLELDFHPGPAKRQKARLEEQPYKNGTSGRQEEETCSRYVKTESFTPKPPPPGERLRGDYHVEVKRPKVRAASSSKDSERPRGASDDSPNDGAKPFTLLVAAKSDLILDAQLHPTSLTPGAKILASVRLGEAGLPIDHERAQVVVEIHHPDGGTSSHPLTERSPGRFAAEIETFRPGVYGAHFVATGRTLLDAKFRRELLQTTVLEGATRKLV